MQQGGPHPIAPAFAAQSQFHSISAVARPFLSCWIRLYGLLCMEVLHQLDFAYTDLEPVFEECLGGASPARVSASGRLRTWVGWTRSLAMKPVGHPPRRERAV